MMQPGATTLQSKPRLKTLVRASVDQLPPFSLRARDKQIIHAVYTHRALTTDQIHALLFSSTTPGATYGKKTRCQLRLKLLFHHGYLTRKELPTTRSEGSKPFLYLLDTRALSILPDLLDCELEDIDWQPKDNALTTFYLAHLMQNNEVRIAIEAAAATSGYTIETWLDDQTLKKLLANEKVTIKGEKGGSYKVTVIPDDYFHLWTGEKHLRHLVEVDRGTETGKSGVDARRDWQRKVKGYLAFLHSGLYETYFQAKTVRILTVTTTARRLNTLKTITEEVGGKHLFWFTTFAELTKDTALTAPIWQVATREGTHTLLL